jgi:hypothetical protein
VFTARYGLMPYIKKITFRLLKVNIWQPSGCFVYLHYAHPVLWFLRIAQPAAITSLLSINRMIIKIEIGCVLWEVRNESLNIIQVNFRVCGVKPSRSAGKGKGKGKGTPNRPEGPEGVRGIPLLFLDLGARRKWVVSTTPRPLYPREGPGTHCTGGWVGPSAGLDVCEKSRPHRDSSRSADSHEITVYMEHRLLQKTAALTPTAMQMSSVTVGYMLSPHTHTQNLIS